MPEQNPYNPLDKHHLGESVANAILSNPVEPLPPDNDFTGAGIYAIYYFGDFPLYSQIAVQNKGGKYNCPIYVGKAIPKGGRRGSLTPTVGRVLYSRVAEHAKSIEQATNLGLEDFVCRYLVVDAIWIPLGESLLIQRFSPVWNTTLDGFGNHDPGGGRRNQQRSSWDVVHPGRGWAERLAENKKSESEITESVKTAIDAIPDA